MSNPNKSEPKDPFIDRKAMEEEIRYKPRGFGMVVAILITIFFLTVFPYIVRDILKFLLARYDYQTFSMILSIALHTGVYMLGHSVFYFIYTSKIPFFERYRIIQGPWPWESNPEQWRKLLKETVLTTLFGNIVIIPFLAYRDSQGEPGLDMDLDKVPNALQIVMQIGIASIIEDAWFYWGHRLIHHPLLYNWIHKKHHKYSMAVSIAAEHQHILEYVFVSLMSTSVPLMILGKRVHIITSVVYGVFRICEAVNAHCGYDFSWAPYRYLPLCQPSSWHNFHHSHNVGNYSAGYWDYICGTHKPYLEYLKRMEAKDKARAQLNTDQKTK